MTNRLPPAGPCCTAAFEILPILAVHQHKTLHGLSLAEPSEMQHGLLVVQQVGELGGNKVSEFFVGEQTARPASWRQPKRRRLRPGALFQYERIVKINAHPGSDEVPVYQYAVCAPCALGSTGVLISLIK
jgi:hypothetical protein